MKIDDQFMELVLNLSKEDLKKIRILTSDFFNVLPSMHDSRKLVTR